MIEQDNSSNSSILSRGLCIIRLLEKGEALNQLEIVNATGFPRTTVKRILEVLEQENVLSRDNQRKYRARLGLLPLYSDDEFDSRLKQKMNELAAQTRQTVEWYVPSPDGMVLIRRYIPDDGETGVTAKVGYCRRYDGEIDSVNALALGWFHENTPHGLLGHKGYIKPGKLEELTPQEAKARVMLALSCPAVSDTTVNSNNVQRVSAAVFSNNKGVGIISLALIITDMQRDNVSGYLKILKQYAQGLSDNCTLWDN